MERPRVEEIGPFVYEARQTKEIVDWTTDEIAFRAKTRYKFVPEESVVDDPKTVKLTMPNMILFTGMLKSEVKALPEVVRRNVIWPTLTSAGRKVPFLTGISAEEYLWGYEDELACIGSDDDDDEGEFGEDDDDWATFDIPEENTKAKKGRNFRQDDGRCLFGALVERNTTWDGTVRISTGATDFRSKGKIVSIGGKKKFGKWKGPCDIVAGDQVGDYRTEEINV